MQNTFVRRGLIVIIMLLFVGTSIESSIMNVKGNNSISDTENSQSTSILKRVLSASMYFTENKGQFPDEVLFQTYTAGVTVYLCKDKIVTVFTNITSDQTIKSPELDTLHFNDTEPRLSIISIVTRFIGMNTMTTATGVDVLPYRNNYFLGNDPTQWHSDVRNYQSVTYQDLYPGIDLKYYYKDGSLKYDFLVQPGANPSNIKIRYEGNQNLQKTEQGNLNIISRLGTFSEKAPVIWQEIAGIRTPIAGQYLIDDNGEISFAINRWYDARYQLVIDPILMYSTYLGGTNDDIVQGIAVDSIGNAYITGYTMSSDFPMVNPYDGTYNGNYDVFVSKLSSAGNSLIYSTYLGGTGTDYGHHIAIDGTGNVYVIGSTESSDFPMVYPYDGTYNGNGDVFVAKLSSAGNSIIYSTYLGGGLQDYGNGITVDGTGNAYITGSTISSDFPMVNPYDGTNNGNYDVFVSKLSSAGNSIIYSTYLGGSLLDAGSGITVDGTGNAYITGCTGSSNFPMVNSYDSIYNGGQYDVFVSKLSSAGNSLIYSTYLGGNDWDLGHSIMVDGIGNAYITGQTGSSNFPVVNPYDGTFNGYYDVFVAKLSPAGNTLIYSTYLGGTNNDWPNSIAVDGNGHAYITGYTESSDFPMVNPYDPSYNGGLGDVFVVELSSAGNSLIYSTYLGGTNEDEGCGIALDGTGNAYITGYTMSSDFPMVNPYDGTYNGNRDVFVAKLGKIANAGGPYTGYLSGHTVFMGSASGGTPPYSYAWDLDNDGSYDDATGYLAARTWTATGTYTVGLKVTDNNGHTDTDNAQVTVVSTNAPYCQGIPGYTTGDHNTRIDIVYIMDTDYNNDIVHFIGDVRDQIQGTYNHIYPIDNHMDSFNFWYTEHNGHYAETCLFTLPDHFKDNCPWADIAIILHTRNLRDCSNLGNNPPICSGEGAFPGTNQYCSIIHEMGHAIFGLGDEYRDNPDPQNQCTYYGASTPYPNIFDSQQAAMNQLTLLHNEGWDTSTLQVFHFCDPVDSDCCRRNNHPNGWWKLCPDGLCIMDSATPDDGFGVACQARIQHVLNNFADEFDNWALEIQLEWNNTNSSFEITGTKLLNDSAPNNLRQFDTIKGEINSFNGKLLYGFNISSPLFFAEGCGCDGNGIFKDNATNTTIIIPYFYNAENVSFYNESTNQFITSLNVTKYATGNIKGTVSDYFGKPVYNASIQIVGPEVKITLSDLDGTYSLRHISPGSYTITVVPPISSGLTSASYNIMVVKGENNSINFTLLPQLKNTFLLGFIGNKSVSAEFVRFNAKLLFCAFLTPFSPKVYQHNESLLISKNYTGFVGSRFIFGFFNAAVISESNLSKVFPLRDLLFNRFYENPKLR